MEFIYFFGSKSKEWINDNSDRNNKKKMDNDDSDCNSRRNKGGNNMSRIPDSN